MILLYRGSNDYVLGNFKKFSEDKSEIKALVFSLEDCDPCASLKKTLDEMLSNGTLRIPVYILQPSKKDALNEFVNSFNVTHFPTLNLYRNGSLIGEKKGFPSLGKSTEQHLLFWIDKKMKKNN